MWKVVAIMMAAIYLAACGAPSSISGSTMKSVATVTRPDALEVGDGASASSAASEAGSHPGKPVAARVEPVPPTPVLRPAAPPPVADPDHALPGFKCEGFNGLDKPKLMCAAQ